MATAATPVDLLKPSPGKTNYTRLLTLVMCGGKIIIRGVFDSIIPPSDLATELNKPAVMTRLHQMKGKMILTNKQWQVLFPSPGTCVKSESFDITLLFKLLRLKELCGLSQPPTGWDKLPDDKNLSLSADLARIKYYRNELCHPKEDMEVSDDDFNDHGQQIKDALLRMVKVSLVSSKILEWETTIDDVLTGERNIEEMLEKLSKEMLEQRQLQQGEKLERFLKEYYQKGERTFILPFPWMEGERFHIEKLCTRTIIVDKDRKREVQLQDLFSPPQNPHEKKPKRILIEGESGIGKSTVCKKLAYDWSKDKLTSDIALVLVIKCHDLINNSNIWQAIVEQNLPREIQEKEKEETFSFIRNNQERVLILIDGFDEIPTATDATMKQSIVELINSQLLSSCCVIVTSRPEKCSEIRKHFDKKLEMKGFNWEDSCDFIKSFFSLSPNTAEATISSIEEVSAVCELIRSPLNTAFLCLVLEEKKEDKHFFKTLDLGTLYQEIVFCVTKRYRVEKQRQEVNDGTLMKEFHDIYVVLGEIALNLMKENLTHFVEEQLPVTGDSKQVLKDIGFIIEQKSLNTIRPTSSYMFSHSSIKEYFAALYVAESLRDGNIDVLAFILSLKVNQSSTCIGNSNHVQNIYYSLQRFNMAKMTTLSSSVDCAKLINRLASRLPVDIDVSPTELVRFDFIFSFICELLGNCNDDQVTEVLNEIELPDVPLILYLYNGELALKGCTSLLRHSVEESPKLKIKIFRLEGLQVAFSCISPTFFEEFLTALGRQTFLESLYLFFFSKRSYFSDFFSDFHSESLKNLSLSYVPQDLVADETFFKILRNLQNLSYLDLSNSLITVAHCKDIVEGLSENHSLQVLKLCNCNLDPDSVEAIFYALHDNITLTEIDLSGNDLSHSDYFPFRMKNKLQVIKLCNCNLGPDSVVAMVSELCDNNTLTEIDLSGNEINGEDKFYIKCIQSENPRVKIIF